MYKRLSYPLGPTTPTYGDNPPVRFTVLADMARGDVANWLEVTTINHSGTHIDAPYHFNPRGKRITDLTMNELAFTAPRLIDVPKGDGELVNAHDLQAHHADVGVADLLLVRTGWATAHRAGDPERFGLQAPGFDSSAGRYLLEETSVRALAMDVPSAASPVAGVPNDEGLEFHRIVLGTGKKAEERYILLIEDVQLEPELEQSDLRRVLVVPLFLQAADAAPVTILAEA